MFELFEHTADLGLRVRAASLPDLFVDAGRGLASAIITDWQATGHSEQRRLEISGESLDYLLFDWLNELLFLFESEQLIFNRFEVQFDPLGESQHPRSLAAVCYGQTVDLARGSFEHEVKAITYHGLKVEATAAGEWEAELILDI